MDVWVVGGHLGDRLGLDEALDDEAGFGELGAPALEGLAPPPHVPPALPGVLEQLVSK